MSSKFLRLLKMSKAKVSYIFDTRRFAIAWLLQEFGLKCL
jgi:hypothetical protein